MDVPSIIEDYTEEEIATAIKDLKQIVDTTQDQGYAMAASIGLQAIEQLT